MADPRSTLADVARAAGVGPATVSRALNDRPDVNEATRERIKRIAADLGYRPSGTARALRRGSFRAVSAIVPDRVWGWWEPVLRSAAAAAEDAGYHLFVHPVGESAGLAATVEGLANVPTEGVIVVSVSDQRELRAACDRIGLPAIAVDDTSHTVHLPSIAAANRTSARRMTEYLISQGHRRIAYVGAASEFIAPWGEGLFAEERLAGYREALESAGIPFDPALVLDWPTPADESTPTIPALDGLLSEGTLPDAVFCAADLLGAPLLRTLSAHGLSAPHDVSVTGFDDERAAVLLNPQLTTVRQPYDEMGRLAFELLLRSIRGEVVPVRRYDLETELIVRDSTRFRQRS